MTIDAGWVKILKKERPKAFTDKAPQCLQGPHCVFVDGQVKLMKAEAINTWKLFLERQFYNTIHQAFKHGAKVVVMGFDNYDFVPLAKAPTQRKRCSHHKALNFTNSDDLPPLPPEDWNGALRNRVFKTKVISMIVCNLMHEFGKLMQDDKDKTLVIDWQAAPEVIGAPLDLPQTLSDTNQRRGECDVKAFVWRELGLPLLIMSTDGDFLPMGMLQIEKDQQENDRVPSIFLYRMKTRIEPQKRTSSGHTKREYEFVDVNELCQYVQATVLCTSNPGVRARVFAFAVACCGCDFAMSLPNIGPTKLWQVLRINAGHPKIAPQLNLSARQAMWEEDICQALLLAVLPLYGSIYKKYLPTQEPVRRIAEHSLEGGLHVYEHMSQTVMNHKSGAPRIGMWSAKRMNAHLLNAAWTVQYWQLLGLYPDPLTTDINMNPTYGFITNKRGVVDFAGT